MIFNTINEAANGELTIQHYLEDPDPVLSVRCPEVEENEFSSNLEKVSYSIWQVMLSGRNGIGLAAPQAGVMKRLFVMKDENGERKVCVNPVLEFPDTITATGQEGCLSVPGVYNFVQRYKTVRMTYRDLYGVLHTEVLRDLPARVAQHEVDHLDGLMFFDRMGRNMRRAILRDWEKERRKRKI